MLLILGIREDNEAIRLYVYM
uniref:Uncharacterized protein n=1 Tax=Arundo donax TaxID=35708 RepID=A0A0A9BKS0_ARUDO